VHGATLRQAHAQRKAVEAITGLKVEPLLVFSRAWVDRPLGRRKGVRVLPARMVLGYVTRRRPSLSTGEVEMAHRQLAAALSEHRQRVRLRERAASWSRL
jgi:hypothetical protein